MSQDPVVPVLGGLVAVLLVAVLVLWFRRAGSAAVSEEALRPRLHDDLATWVLEGRRLFTTWQERIEGLNELKSRLGGLAEEADRLRIEVSHVQEMRAQIVQLSDQNGRLTDENQRCRTEHAEYRDLLARIATLAQEATAKQPSGP
jgi:regulator of replication initiation timing